MQTVTAGAPLNWIWTLWGSAPVFDSDGEVAGAPSVVAMRRRMPAERLDAIVVAVRSAAADLTEQLTLVGS